MIWTTEKADQGRLIILEDARGERISVLIPKLQRALRADGGHHIENVCRDMHAAAYEVYGMDVPKLQAVARL